MLSLRVPPDVLKGNSVTKEQTTTVKYHMDNQLSPWSPINKTQTTDVKIGNNSKKKANN